MAIGLKLLALLERGRGSLLEGTRYILAAYHSDPTDPGIMMSLAMFLGSYMGRMELSEPIMNRVLAVDPLNGFNWLVAGVFMFSMDDPEEALKRLRRSRELSPNLPHTQFWVGHVLGGSGQSAAALDVLDEAIESGMPPPIGNLALFLRSCLARDEDAAIAALNEDTRKYAWADPDFSFLMPGYFATINRTEEALEWLQHAVDRSYMNLPYLEKTGPYLENLRSEPRFKELLGEIRVKREGLEFHLEV